VIPILAHLVIPSYNEGNRLPDYLPRLSEALADVPFQWRITIVDDGSREDHSRKMQDCVRRCGPRVAYSRLPVNLGKGGAVYSGWDSARDSEWLGLLDADGSIPPYEVVRLLGMLGTGDSLDALFASRCKILGHTIQRSWLRHVGGRLFATLVAAATGIPVYDSQCGFKLIRRKSYEAIRSELRERRFAFDVELLVVLRSIGANVIEVPIDWFDVPGSKLHFVRDSAQMLAAVIGMRMRNSRRRDDSHRN
jgi:dolichyl-phosphate beta-glucosyltransferase